VIARWERVALEAIACDLPEERLTSAAVEERLSLLYAALRLAPGQIEALTGIRERRLYPRGTRMAEAAARAARRALDASGIAPADLGAVVFAGVCRDDLEPATACAVAEAIGAPPEALVYDVSNACLGVLNGMIDVANRIEMGQARAGLVVSAESSRDIIGSTIARMTSEATMEAFRLGLATMTGGSGAAAVLLVDASLSDAGHRLAGAVALAAPEHHRICRWGPREGLLGETPNVMTTDASAVLQHGVALGRRTFERFLDALGWRREDLDKVICHQVGGGHRRAILDALGIDAEKDFSSFETLGNMGTAAIPATAALAAEAGHLAPGDRVGLLGIGSGLNCLMAGVRW
jgi:3-oxoacyl-[acyl-carrier-protein] synthase-3